MRKPPEISLLASRNLIPDVQSLRFCRIAIGRADERQLPERQFDYAMEKKRASNAANRADSA